MSGFFKKILFWVILIVLILGTVLFINWRIDSNKNGKEKSENNSHQKTPKSPDKPEPVPPTDTENWWLTDEEIEHAYQEMEKELGNSAEIKLVSPSVVRVIQEGGEVSEDLKKAKIIFFPINNSEQHETAGAGSHWTLLALHKEGKILGGYHYNSLGSSITDNGKKLTDNFRQKLSINEENNLIYPAKNTPQQVNGADCGVYVIAFTRALVKRFREGSTHDWGLKEQDLIFTTAEERQKLKAAGFPKN